jgi:hypothetical protein
MIPWKHLVPVAGLFLATRAARAGEQAAEINAVNSYSNDVKAMRLSTQRSLRHATSQ